MDDTGARFLSGIGRGVRLDETEVSLLAGTSCLIGGGGSRDEAAAARLRCSVRALIDQDPGITSNKIADAYGAEGARVLSAKEAMGNHSSLAELSRLS